MSFLKLFLSIIFIVNIFTQFLNADARYMTEWTNPDGTKSKSPATFYSIKEAKILYDRYCVHCHGDKGMGEGLVGKVYKGVTAYNSRAVKDRSEGHIFHVITHGKGRMWGHGSQISIEDRWKIVKYVQTLQKQ